MTKDYFRDLLNAHIERGDEQSSYWWDEERIPLGSIDKRVTELLDLTGKRVVVTGGAGLNLGQACVNRLAGLGADVAVVDLSADDAVGSGHQRWAAPPDAEGVARAAADKWQAKVIAVHGDVMSWDGVQSVMRECAERLGGIDILVNNAADTANGEFADLSHADIDRSVRGTLVGPLYCSRVALDFMIPQGGGCIINIGSEAGLSAMPGLTIYGSLKAGLAAFTEFLGKEVAKHGVRVLGVNAGSMWGPNRPLPTDVAGTLYPRGRTAIQRYELPEEVANMVAFLASDAASCMAGTMVNMGGGMSI
jgi:3-oxoacyl-[acyl-carrier protein] reductase